MKFFRIHSHSKENLEVCYSISFQSPRNVAEILENTRLKKLRQEKESKL